jgi:hypothetical protein
MASDNVYDRIDLMTQSVLHDTMSVVTDTVEHALCGLNQPGLSRQETVQRHVPSGACSPRKSKISIELNSAHQERSP